MCCLVDKKVNSVLYLSLIFNYKSHWWCIYLLFIKLLYSISSFGRLSNSNKMFKLFMRLLKIFLAIFSRVVRKQYKHNNIEHLNSSLILHEALVHKFFFNSKYKVFFKNTSVTTLFKKKKLIVTIDSFS